MQHQLSSPQEQQADRLYLYTPEVLLGREEESRASRRLATSLPDEIWLHAREMSCFLEILQCVLCCDEGGKRKRDADEDFFEIPWPPRPDPWISRPRSPPRIYTPISLPAETRRSAATIVVGSSSQRAKQPIDERITPFGSASVGSNRQAQTKQQPSASSKLSVTSVPSPPVSEKDRPKQPPASKILISPSALAPPMKSSGSVAGSDASRKLMIGTISVVAVKESPQTLVATPPARDPPKKPLGSMAGPDPPKKPLGSMVPMAGPDPPKKPLGSMAGPDPPRQQPNSPETVWKPKIKLPTYEIPENFEDAIKRDKVPEVLKRPLSPSIYRDHFAALLYAEDYYLEKSGKTVFSFEQTNKVERVQEEKRIYVAFEIDSIPEKRPYLLSRDFVFVQPQGKNVKFKGILSRVVKSTRVLVEFGLDFHSQHSAKRKYDVSFSFNRVCLKRSHQAIEAAIDPQFRNFLFPSPIPRSRSFIPSSFLPLCQNLDAKQISTIHQMISLRGSPPYLVVYQLFSPISKQRARDVILEAILQIYRRSKDSRILVTAPKNLTCDSLMRSLKKVKVIPEDEMFRANAAFRELEDVPDDILTSSLYEGECFTCPSLQDLRKFKVITSTFVSGFRLHSAGIYAGHFTHIFMVDASFATEPETMITLANLADERTSVVMAGSWGVGPDRVRADVARRYGLKTSYFGRLLVSEPYSQADPSFVATFDGV
ncbi:hypothetical protein ACLOJK_014332 [Asimina triloba]